MSLFPVQAINELASEFKLLRKDIQAIRLSLARLEQKLVGASPLSSDQSEPINYSSPKPASNLFKNQN